MSSDAIRNNTTRFMRDIPGSVSKIRDVDSRISSSGDLVELEDIDALLHSIVIALTTVRGTYPFSPQFGLGIQRYIFELNDPDTANKIKIEVYNTIQKYEPRAKADVDVSFFSDLRGILLDIKLEFKGQTRHTQVALDDRLIKTIDDEN